MSLDRTEFLAQRRNGIGGSDIAAIVGLSPWRTPYDVWLDKRGEGEQLDPDTPALYWGTILEDVVAREYGVRSGRRIQRVNAQLVHPDHEFVTANIDRAVVNPEISGVVRWRDGRLSTDRILECKTANGFAAQMWGEAGTDAVPEYYLLQCMWYLGVTGAEVADLAVLIGGSDYRIYSIARDNELIADLYDAGAKFWSLVQSGTAPDPQSVSDAQRMWPRHIAGRSVIVDVDVASACRRLAQVKAEAKALEDEETRLKDVICCAFGDAEEITNGGVKLATWKAQSVSRLNVKALQAAHPDIAALFTDTTETRVLRLAKGAKE